MKQTLQLRYLDYQGHCEPNRNGVYGNTCRRDGGTTDEEKKPTTGDSTNGGENAGGSVNTGGSENAGGGTGSENGDNTDVTI